jgi:hypothetical protein
MTKYFVWVKDPKTGGTFRVVVESDSWDDAQRMVEGQYGSNVIGRVAPV